jgi:hypothetical protein
MENVRPQVKYFSGKARPLVTMAALLVGSHAMAAGTAAPSTVLFMGSSVTWGYTEVENFGVGTVTDLNGCTQTEGGCKAIGGVPAMFKALAKEAGLNYQVSMEMIPGSSLTQHYETKRDVIDRPWDMVVMNGQTTLDFDAPGNPMRITNDLGLLGAMWQAKNPEVTIALLSTWSRADLVYQTPSSLWYGTPIGQMAKHVQAGYQFAIAANPKVNAEIVPVGLAWNRAFQYGIADPNPYDGITAGQVDLWRSGLPPESSNNYHASRFGSYLEALVIFGSVTGLDPRQLGPNEQVAQALNISPRDAGELQVVASDQLKASRKADHAMDEAGETSGGLDSKSHCHTASAQPHPSPGIQPS